VFRRYTHVEIHCAGEGRGERVLFVTKDKEETASVLGEMHAPEQQRFAKLIGKFDVV